MKFYFSSLLILTTLMSLSACGPTPAQQTTNPSTSPSGSNTSGRVYTEAEVEAAISCFETNSNVALKASGGQFRFAFENSKRNKTLLGAEAYQNSLNTTGNALLQIQTSSAAGAGCVK